MGKYFEQVVKNSRGFYLKIIIRREGIEIPQMILGLGIVI